MVIISYNIIVQLQEKGTNFDKERGKKAKGPSKTCLFRMINLLMLLKTFIIKQKNINQQIQMNSKNTNNSIPAYLKNTDIRQNSVVILTGASSGLGRQMALKLARMNITLVIIARNKERLQLTKKECSSFLTAKVQSIEADLIQQSTCKYVVQKVLNKFGRIDVLILNAGINAHFLFAQLKDLSIFDKLMKTNFYANVYLTKFALTSLRKNQGFIVVISSLSGKFGLPDRSAYCASKFALNGFFESLRTEEEKISICMVYPTSLDTPMRNNDVLGAKPSSNESKNKQQSADIAAELIIGGIKRGQNDIYIPGKYKIGIILQPLFPSFMRNRVKQAAKL